MRGVFKVWPPGHRQLPLKVCELILMQAVTFSTSEVTFLIVELKERNRVRMCNINYKTLIIKQVKYFSFMLLIS